MGLKALQKEMEPLRRELGGAAVDDFLSKMDRDYVAAYPPSEIAEHIRMADRLDAAHPVQLRLIPKGDRLLDVTVVAFDYFSEFSILSGLLSSFGLDIQAGEVHTFSEGETRGDVRGRRKIVDTFQVRPMAGAVWDPPTERAFETALQQLIRQLEAGSFREARDQVSRRLIEFLGKRKEAVQGFLSPVQIRFDNRRSSRWTRLDIRGKDTPGFLYAFSNALALREIYIHRVKIQNVENGAHDLLYISDKRGRKIEQERDRKALRISALLIKQFTHFLTQAPDPSKAITHFDQLLDKIMEAGAETSGKKSPHLISLLKENETLNALAHLFGASDFLWEDFLRMQFENFLPLLGEIRKRPLRIGLTAVRRALQRRLRGVSDPQDQKRILNDYKDQEMFRIDMRHLFDPIGTLSDFSEALTDLAEGVVDRAYRICYRRLIQKHGLPRLAGGAVSPFSICAQGKFGGRELGYASDIELLFVYGGPGKTAGERSIENKLFFEELSQQMIRLVEAKREGIFQIDTRLRPYGSSGAPAISLHQFVSYYAPDGEAAPFERQALIKLRTVGGDRPLGKKIEAHRDRFVYGGFPWDLEIALRLRERQMKELVPAGKVNVKYSAGGLIDIEYLTQYLQLIHGARHPSLRTPNTLQGLVQLRRAGLLTADRESRLREAYLFLRSLIDALRMVRGHAKDLVLPDPGSEEFTFLGRRMGYGRRDWEKGRRELETKIHSHMTAVHRIFKALFYVGGGSVAPSRKR